MAGGPIFPHSAFPVTAGRVFPNIHVGAGATSKHDVGLGVEASVGADCIWRLRFKMPPTLPTGSPTLDLWALANATTGNAKPHVKWASVAADESPSGATLQNEGVGTLTWAAGDNDQYKRLKVILDADTIVANEIVVMDITFETASWTLAQVSTWQASIIWE
jgi:hypothetical protein